MRQTHKIENGTPFSPRLRACDSCGPIHEREGDYMLGWILTLLAIAAIAALLGFGRLSGIALSGAKLLIIIALVLFLLMAIGILAI